MAEKNEQRKIYIEGIIGNDEHLSNKIDEEGYRSALKFLDGSNDLNGPPKVREIDIDQLTHKNDLKIAEFLAETAKYKAQERQQKHEMLIERLEIANDLVKNTSDLVSNCSGLVYVYLVHVRPTLKNRTIPWIKKQISAILPKKKSEDTEERDVHHPIEQETDQILQLLQNPESFMNNVDKAYSKFRFSMEEEEAKQHFMKIIFLAFALAKEIRYMSGKMVVPNSVKLDDNLRDRWKTVFEEIASTRILDAINTILQSNSPLLNAPSMLTIYPLIGGEITEEKELLPLKLERFKSAFEIEERIE